MNIREMNERNTRRSARTIAAFLCMMMVFSLVAAGPGATFATSTGTSTGAGNAFKDMVNNLTNEIYATMRGIVIPIVICFVAYAAFCFLTGGARGSEKAVTILKFCVATVFLVAFAPLIGQQLGNWVKDSGTGDVSSFNSLG